MATTNLWISAPAQAHCAWREGLTVADRSYSVQSQRLYNSLFGRFCAWMAIQKKTCTLKTLTRLDLAKFLDSLKGRNGKEAANRTQRTYVAEIDRVFAHLQNEGVRKDNPARELLETLRITTPLRPRSIKIPISTTRERYLASVAAQTLKKMLPDAIQACAMNFLMMDGGFTLKELQKLVLKHVDHLGEGRVIAPGHRLLLARPVQLSTEAVTWLRRWLAVREDLRIVTPAQYQTLQSAAKLGMELKSIASTSQARSGRSKVFVSFTGKSGKPLGLRSSGLVIDHLPESTIYLSAQQVLLAGQDLTPDQRKKIKNKGPQALRNLCCATLVSKRMPSGEVAAFMGLRRSDQVWAMERALKID